MLPQGQGHGRFGDQGAVHRWPPGQEIVLLAGGMPYITAFPLDAIGDMASSQLVSQRGAVALHRYAIRPG